jgi:Na+/H+ antiporter NhaC
LIAAGFIAAGITEQPFSVFLKTIPFNFYALGAIMMVPLIIFSKKEFGPMAVAEKRAIEEGKPLKELENSQIQDDFKVMICSTRGKVSDMLFPVLILFFGSFGFMLYTGGYFDGGVSFGEAFNETDVAGSLIYGIFLAIVVAILLYHIRGNVKILESTQAMVVGMKSMYFALFILTLAWSIGAICDELGTGEYLSDLIGGVIPGTLTPFLIFILSCFTAFSTGASWGTYAIMIPIAIPLAIATDANIVISLAAVLSGGVFGDHCSPLADTTILSSAGAAVNHMDHVSTQLPYAITVGICASVGFLLAGFLDSFFIPLLVTLGLIVVAVFILTKYKGYDTSKAGPPSI